MREEKACRKKIGEGAALVDTSAPDVGRGKQDRDGGWIGGELKQRLAAGTAGRGGGPVEVGDRNGPETNGGAELSDG